MKCLSANSRRSRYIRVLLTWNLTDVDATSALLSDEAAQHWELSEKTDSNPELRRRLLYRLREPAVTQLGDNFSAMNFFVIY